jgi:hypothetical protein
VGHELLWEKEHGEVSLLAPDSVPQSHLTLGPLQ